MGQAYLPTWMVDVSSDIVGKNTVHPMDPMGLNEKGYFPLEQNMMLFLDVFWTNACQTKS